MMEDIGKSHFSLADRSRLVFQITAKAMPVAEAATSSKHSNGTTTLSLNSYF